MPMIIKNNLRFVRPSNNTGRGMYDGIFTKRNSYYVTFCHGDESGLLYLQIDDDIKGVEPLEIRARIKDYLHVNISKQQKVFINPCFPKQVKERYKDQLKENNIGVMCGNWKDETSFCIYDGNDLIGCGMNFIKKSYPISMIIDRQSKLRPIYNSGELKNRIKDLIKP
jgi:hypothetical protein